MWHQVLAEPRWLIIAGLGLDMVGGVLVALTAWSRVRVSISPISAPMGGAPMGVIGTGSEPGSGLKWRRRSVVAGAALLALGFAMQIWGTWLQMP